MRAYFKTLLHAYTEGKSQTHKPVDFCTPHIYGVALCGHCPSEATRQHITLVNRAGPLPLARVSHTHTPQR